MSSTRDRKQRVGDKRCSHVMDVQPEEEKSKGATQTLAVLRRTQLLILGSASLLMLSGCLLPSRNVSPTEWGAVRTQLSKEELGERLAHFVDYVEASLRDAADVIVIRQPDRRTRRLLLLMQTRLLPMWREAIEQDDAVHGMLDAWVMALRMHHYFVDGDARRMFGEHQPVMIDASRLALAAIEEIASGILTPDGLERARHAVDDLARRFPIRGEFSGTTVRTAVQKAEQDSDILTSILTAPIAPFRSLGGIDRGAAAIQGFTVVAARMNDTVQDLPESVRLQTQLLLMETEELESLQSLLASVEQLAQSSSSISATAEQLPEQIRRQLVIASEEMESRQVEFRQTLREAQETVARVHEALGRVESAASAVDQTAMHTTQAGDAWTRTFQAITHMVDSFRTPASDDDAGHEALPLRQGTAATAGRGPVPPVDGEDAAETRSGEGFDIREYTVAAREFDRAAIQLQALIREIRGLTASPELAHSLDDAERRAQRTLELSRSGAKDVIDHLAWRGVQLIVLMFLAMMVYRFLVQRFTGCVGGMEFRNR